MKQLYITHCSREKDMALEKNGERATPDRLYTSPALKRFIRHCQSQGLAWAIFSDK